MLNKQQEQLFTKTNTTALKHAEKNKTNRKKNVQCAQKEQQCVRTFLPPPSISAAAPADASALSDCQTAFLCGCEDKTILGDKNANITCQIKFLLVHIEEESQSQYQTGSHFNFFVKNIFVV